MIAIVDNGRGAEEISRCLKTKNQIIKLGEKITGSVIITDGTMKKGFQSEIKKIVKKNVPILGIGLGACYMCEAFGAKIKKTKDEEKQGRLYLHKHSPILLNFKKFFSVYKNCCYGIDAIPENFCMVAATKTNDIWVLQDFENPFFAVNFNPELGLDGMKILENFEKFINIWEKYNK